MKKKRKGKRAAKRVFSFAAQDSVDDVGRNMFRIFHHDLPMFTGGYIQKTPYNNTVRILVNIKIIQILKSCY